MKEHSLMDFIIKHEARFNKVTCLRDHYNLANKFLRRDLYIVLLKLIEKISDISGKINTVARF